jgi:poly-gamma-glutamate synthesis protein (capsule biosynthesis protein)
LAFRRSSFAALFVSVFLVCLPGDPAPPALLAWVGDVMLGRGVARALDGNWEAAFAEVQPWLAEADLTLANLESPLTTAPQLSNGYDLRAPPEAVAALRAAGFDAVSLANNHALDAGQTGLDETVATLRTAGIRGVQGSKIDTLAGQGVLRRTTNYQLLAFDDSAAPLDLEAASRQVVDAASQTALVIVSVHWGGEYQAGPSLRQRAIARALAGAGASLIVGHGPHVLQPVEWVGRTLVAYSLGNFLFDQPYPADCRWGVILRVTVRSSRVTAVEPLPTVTEKGRVRPATSGEAAAILARLTP